MGTGGLPAGPEWFELKIPGLAPLSLTVARPKRIPIEQRAEAATIAWMRHQTTAYDDMKIPRVKGKRREVRRMLADRSRDLLDHYRKAAPRSETCPLAAALSAS